jgi:tetratricopeptide (TPR) repeat protein
LAGSIPGVAEHGGRCRRLPAKAIELEPGNVYAWHNMGLTYLETGKPWEAIRCFEKALSIEDRADTRHFLEQAYEEMTD